MTTQRSSPSQQALEQCKKGENAHCSASKSHSLPISLHRLSTWVTGSRVQDARIPPVVVHCSQQFLLDTLYTGLR